MDSKGVQCLEERKQILIQKRFPKIPVSLSCFRGKVFVVVILLLFSFWEAP